MRKRRKRRGTSNNGKRKKESPSLGTCKKHFHQFTSCLEDLQWLMVYSSQEVGGGFNKWHVV